MVTSQQRGERTDEQPFKSLFQNWDRLFVLVDRSRYINGQRAEIFNYLCLTPLTPLRPLRLGVRKIEFRAGFFEKNKSIYKFTRKERAVKPEP